MSFSDVVKDGNIARIALQAIRRYQNLGSFSMVLEAYSTEWKSISSVAHNYGRAQESVRTVIDDPLTNFRKLSVLSIWIDSGAEYPTAEDVDNEFGSRVSEILAQHDLV